MQSTTYLTSLYNKINDSKSVTVEEDGKGLCVKVNTKYASLTLSLFGGQVLSFITKENNLDRLWLSEKAIFDGKTPIRGGVPICWPWFSSHIKDASLPSHGFARTQMFTLVDIKETFSEQEVTQTQLILIPSQSDLYGYNKLHMKLVIVISDSLNITVITVNNSNSAVSLTQALHTYLRVDNIESIVIEGVSSDYDDKPTNTSGNKAPVPYTFKGEVDRIHSHQHHDYTLAQTVEVLSNTSDKGSSLSPLVKVNQDGHDSIVVWNPGKDRSIGMKDMEDDGYVTMVCIEAANTNNAEKPLSLMPNQDHKLSQTIS